ncbi:class I SAM-dependent methyltransferase [Aestuariivirga litoralis]|uniref:class I SAM-dependent methyltransferase n=1 Tax=Aestuariivirga litoralis TaxID=2650924 RepID=UPI0018C73891|nr:methyltransferase domain-containing protein [Aestuariivirga litoralis]MBG1231830.1 methyltransferase domain-containing protein [Aestuariivirga litoralis]
MAQTDKVFSSPIARLYDSQMGPVFFEPYAKELAGRIVKLKPDTILETAAGSGISTAAIVAALPNAQIVGTDLNQAMIDVASQKPELQSVTWQACDATKLPFADQAFDLVACQFGVMFFPDRVVGYKEARRVLKPGGHFIFNVWGFFDERNPTPVALLEALADIFPDDPPTFLKRLPHGYHDVDLIKKDLEAAGFRDIQSASVSLPCHAASAHQLAVALCQGTPTRGEIETRDPQGLERVTELVAKAFAAKFGHGTIESTMQAFVISAAN